MSTSQEVSSLVWIVFLCCSWLKLSGASIVSSPFLDGGCPTRRTWTTRTRHQSLRSSSSSSAIHASSQQTEPVSAHTFESQESFWGRERSADEIERFVTETLISVDSILTPRIEVVSSEPPLVVIHNFTSSNDCVDIVEAARNQQMQRSTMGATQEESTGRTSSTAWLKESSCPGPLCRIAEKTYRLIQLPPSHMENLQVVKYTAGQEFTLHTDHLDSFNDLKCRGRLATCLVYLDAPNKGGETSFPEFGVSIPPTSGTAVFFFNTRERPGMEGYDPFMFLNVDPRLRHAGLPVLKGEKWICNRWIHPIDYGAGVRGTSGL